MRKAISTVLLVLLISSSCQVYKSEKYVPASSRKREKYATPEPGTYLKPVAYSLLKKINQALNDPEAFSEPSDWMVRVLTTHQRKVVDTILTSINTDVPVRIYYPSKKTQTGNQPVIVYFHGGGFVYGSVEQYDMMVSKLAKVIDHVVISVEYRLAPEHPFPAGVTDGFAVLQWVQQHGALIGVDPERICVMGDSSGGNIATVLTLMCRDNNLPQPYCQVLIYPGVTFSDTLYASRKYFGQSNELIYVLSEPFLRTVKSRYLGDDNPVDHPYVSPLEAELSQDLAPTLIITAECDPIRDDGRHYAMKLKEAGIEVVHLEYSGMIHGFLSFHMILSEALDAMKEIRDYLNAV